MFDEPDSPVTAPADPKTKQAMTTVEKSLVVCVLVLMGVWYASTSFTAHLAMSKVAAIRPEMLALAEQRKPDAVLWVMDHPEKPDVQFQEKLKAVAETGHPEAMYRYGLLLKYTGRADESDFWVAKSAAEGFPEAVLASQKQ